MVVLLIISRYIFNDDILRVPVIAHSHSLVIVFWIDQIVKSTGYTLCTFKYGASAHRPATHTSLGASGRSHPALLNFSVASRIFGGNIDVRVVVQSRRWSRLNNVVNVMVVSRPDSLLKKRRLRIVKCKLVPIRWVRSVFTTATCFTFFLNFLAEIGAPFLNYLGLVEVGQAGDVLSISSGTTSVGGTTALAKTQAVLVVVVVQIIWGEPNVVVSRREGVEVRFICIFNHVLVVHVFRHHLQRLVEHRGEQLFYLWFHSPNGLLDFFDL